MDVNEMGGTSREVIKEKLRRCFDGKIVRKDLTRKIYNVLTESDERLWSCMAEYVTVGRKKEMTVRFKEGTEITI